jgi:hypothetical protein
MEIKMTDKTVLELISEVDEFIEMHHMFQDADLDIALSKIVRIITNPDINPAAAVTGIIHLQGLSSKFYIQASYLKNISKPKAGTEDYSRKNMLYAMSTALDQLVAALKYMVK